MLAMCGIVGVAATKSIESREWLALGRDAIAHRGPDGNGLWWSENGCVGLAHCRLSILDLSSAGHQPMYYQDSGCRLVFNGEIYNHQTLRRELVKLGYIFNSHTDTEVILAAYDRWGLECLSRFKGMFAFALFDPASNRLFVARDRAGEKPLFYSHQNGTFRFGSELKGLMADTTILRSLNPQALDMYLSIGYVPGSDCILDGFNKLPPAHYAIFDMTTGTLEVSSYWQLPLDISSGNNPDHDLNLLKELENLLEKSISMQLLADVPVGVLLSGGVDSSLITAIASRISPKVKTFTVGFSGYGSYDESSHARLISDAFKTDHIELDVGDVGPEMLIPLARQFDEPIVDSSMLPTYLVTRSAREHCTVLLGGDGADELFGGYPKYNHSLLRARRIGYVPQIMRTIISALLPQEFNRAQSWLWDFKTGLPPLSSIFNTKYRERLLLTSNVDISGMCTEEYWRLRTPKSQSLLDRTMRMDFTNYLSEDILVKIDRASMMNSLELRSPFLDSDIIEFAFSRVPERMKATSNQRKIILKMLAKKLLPQRFDMQRKKGFSIPLHHWLKGGLWREFFSDILYDQHSVFNQKVVEELFKDLDLGRNNGRALFSLVMFDLWRKEYCIPL